MITRSLHLPQGCEPENLAALRVVSQTGGPSVMRADRFLPFRRVFPRWWSASAFCGLVLAACGGTQTPPPRQPGQGQVTHLEMEPVRIEARRGTTGLEIEAYDAAELFERAGKSHGEGRFDEAERLYQRLLDAFPTSSFARLGLYNLGLVFQDQKKWAPAIASFKAFVGKYPEGKDGRDAWFQLGATYAESGDWAASRDVFDALLARNDLSADDRVEAMARKGFAVLNQGDLENADATFRGVLAYKQRLEATREERLETDYYLAFSQYQLGQISHRRSNAQPLRWPEPRMNADLEEKARLLLQARRQYIDAVRYGNPRIASMAAFQIGTLFQEFYDALLAVGPPKELEGDTNAEARQVYADELRKKLRIVLQKALRGHEHNLELFERLGVETEWVSKSRDAIAKLKSLLDPGSPLDLGGTGGPGASGASPGPPAPEAPKPGPRDEEPRKPAPGDDVQRQVL